MMNPRDGNSISIESCEKLHKRYALKPDIYSICEIIDDCAITDHIIKDPIDKSSYNDNSHIRPIDSLSSKVRVNAQSTCYKYERRFERTIETYPIFFEWILKKTAVNESSTDLNKVTEHDILLLDNYKSDGNQHSRDPSFSSPNPAPKSSESLSNPNPDSKVPPSFSNPSLDTKPQTENINHKECPIPCVRELKCPKFSPCPPEPSNDGSSGLGGSKGLGGAGGTSGSGGHGGKRLSDPDNVQLQCTTRNINFKLKCSKLPPGCEHPEGTYECEIVDEGKYVDSKELEACDLKCREIDCIHSVCDIMAKEATKDAQDPIIVKKVENKKEDNKPPKKVTTMICSKNGVNFSLKCTSAASEPDYPSDVRFICDIEERKISPDEIFGTPIKCKAIGNAVDDSVLDYVDSNDRIQLFINMQHHNNSIDEKDECPSNPSEEKEKKLECYNYVEEDVLESSVCYDIKDINKENSTNSCLTKLKTNDVECNRNKNDENESADFINPLEDEKRSTITERLQSSFQENHNKTMNILKIATNDLLCKIMDKDQYVPCWKRQNDGNKLECLDAATESCNKVLETVCLTTKSLCKFTRRTIDGYIDPKEKCEPAEPPEFKCKVRKTSGEPLPQDFVTVVKDSAEQIINDITRKNMSEDKEMQPIETIKKSFELESIKNSATKIFNNIKEISQEEFDTVKTINIAKETCINLIDKTSKILSDNTIDSSAHDEPKKVQGYIKEVTSGLIVFQDEEGTKTRPEENLSTRSWTSSLNSILPSLSNTFMKLEPAESLENNTTQKTIESSESEESKERSNKQSSMFTTLKDKICSIFQNDQNQTPYREDSSALADETEDDSKN